MLNFEKNRLEMKDENNSPLNKKNIQKNRRNELIFQNLYPKCEPNLGKRGLYDMIGANKNELNNKISIFWVLILSDGKNSLMDISTRSKIKFSDIELAAKHLLKANLIKSI